MPWASVQGPASSPSCVAMATQSIKGRARIQSRWTYVKEAPCGLALLGKVPRG